MSDNEDELDGPLPGHRASRRREARQDGNQFDINRSWELVSEDASGTLNTSISALLESSKRARLLRDTTPLQRGIIRHVIIILDMSVAMNDKDYRPTRYILSLQYLTTFVNEFFEQNPISQLGIIGMHDGIAIPVSDMSGNPASHLAAISKLRPSASSPRSIEPKGNPSLENALEMARAALFHAPSHGTREILLIFGALHTSDPGDIHATITSLIQSHIRASVIGLAAQVAICAELVSRTNPPLSTHYSIALHEQHYRELLLSHTTPPVTYTTPDSATNKARNTLLTMGFPSRTVSAFPTLCACHTKPSRSGYLCSRCSTKVCSLPSECPVCGLTLILSTHLARSYHHLFPLVNWDEVTLQDAHRSSSCFGCGKPFPELPKSVSPSRARQRQATDNASSSRDFAQLSTPTSRFACPVCHNHFCIDCDLFAHEVVHNCPGCQSLRQDTSLMGETEIEAHHRGEVGMQNGTQAPEAMDIG
jgi:transcription initiation factor TFIIH subunit 2